MITPGEKMNSKIVVGDADSLVALADKQDSNNSKAVKITTWLLSKDYEIIYPNTAILEAITALKRAKNLPDKANLIAEQYLEGAFAVQFISEMIQSQATQRFIKTNSKQDTIFDCLVAEVALELKADFVFSFDKFYTKQGLSLVEV